MKKNLFNLSLIIGLSAISYAQVGVNTDVPKSTLDVSTKYKNATDIDETQTYGLQAPRLTRAELVTVSGTNITTPKYGADQKGAVIYITDVTGIATDVTGTFAQRAKITAVGYYFYDGSVWQPIDTSIYKANGSISGENRIVYFNNSASDNGKMYFTTLNNGANIPAALLTNGAMFNLIGNDTAGNNKPELGIFMLNGNFGNGLRKEAHLWGGTQQAPATKVQFIAYSSIDSESSTSSTDSDRYRKGTVTYLGGKPFSKESMTVDNIKLVVRNQKSLNLDPASPSTGITNATVPFKINGFGTLISGTTTARDDIWRPITTIENTDLYLKNLEHGTNTETAGQVLTLIDNPQETGNLKAVWRNATVVPTEPWNVANSANPTQATSNTQKIYQNAYVGIGDFQKVDPGAAFHLIGKSPTGSGVYNQDNLILEGQSNTDNDPVLALRRSRYNQTTNALEKVNAGDFAGTIQFQPHDGTNFLNNKTGIRGLVTDANANVDMVFFNNTTTSILERMRITSTGNVGIGTNAPNQLLEVNGIIKGNSLTNGNTVYTNKDLGLYNQQNQFTRITSTNGTNSAVAIYTDGAAANSYAGALATIIARNNKVGIGIDNGTPTARLHLKPETGAEVLRIEGLATGNGTVLVVDANGYVKKSPSLNGRSAIDTTELENKVQSLEEKIKLLEEKIEALTRIK